MRYPSELRGLPIETQLRLLSELVERLGYGVVEDREDYGSNVSYHLVTKAEHEAVTKAWNDEVDARFRAKPLRPAKGREALMVKRKFPRRPVPKPTRPHKVLRNLPARKVKHKRRPNEDD